MGHRKVMVIDDDVSLLRLLKKSLEKAGYEVDVASSGAEGLKMMYEQQPDIIVLDVMMPVMDGWEVCRRIRQLSDVPVIMLTAKSDEKDKVRGFKLGVDDYVTKPFSFAEFTARIGAILQRADGDSSAKKPYVYSGKGLTLDIGAHRVKVDDTQIDLTPKEFRLLAALAESNGSPVSTESLLSRVWGPEYRGETEHVKRYIWLLRHKIERNPAKPKLILTERGVGYRLDLED
ncbi:MAG: response regulator transcription factor [Chloroflexota bacterium]